MANFKYWWELFEIILTYMYSSKFDYKLYDKTNSFLVFYRE